MVFLDTDLPNMTGNIIAGRYVLAEVIGTGGFGVVYRATDPHCHEFAVKCLRKIHSGSKREALRQIREMALHKVVSNHPNIIGIREVIDEKEFLYVVMDYCPGGDLFSAIVDRSLFYGRNDLVKHVFLQILDAVEHCHNKKIAHRDIKPENILCNEDFKVFLIDFGLSSKVNFSDEFGCGSAFYMSPECIGKEYGYTPYSTVQSDIWSLGVVLANLITGRNPWATATTCDEHFRSYVYDPDCLPSMLEISVEADLILKRIFTLDPAARITIPELRKAIIRVNSFFPDCSGRPVQPHLTSEDSSLATPAPVLRVINCRTMECAATSEKGVTCSNNLGSPVETYLFPTPDPNIGAQFTPFRYTRIPQLYRSSSSDSDSDEELPVIKTQNQVYSASKVPAFDKDRGLNRSFSISWTPSLKQKFIERNSSAPMVMRPGHRLSQCTYNISYCN